MFATKISRQLGWALALMLVAGCNCGPASSTSDAGSTPDAAVHDSGQADAGGLDAGPRDAGIPDGGMIDAGPPDAGEVDAGEVDAGAADAGTVDAGVPDAGPPDAGSCGDAVVNLAQGEQCDLGAQNGGADSGCSATCQLTAGNYLNEIEPNDTQATANSLAGYAGAVGQLSPAGDVDWYTATVTVPGSSITARVDDGVGGCPAGFDFQLALYSPARAQLVLALPACPAIVPEMTPAATNLAVGTYALEVSNAAGALQPPYVLTVKVSPPGCGDGVLPEGNKQCDPGPTPVAGCSATCQFTGDFIPETEPNDTQGLANPLGTHAGVVGAIKPVGDLDYFSFQVPGPNSLVALQTSDGIGGCPFGFDSLVSLYGPTGNLLVQDDNGGVALCSRISAGTYPQAMNLPGGTYRARVEFNGNNATQWEYVLTVAVSQPFCGDGIVESGEQCDEGALNGTSGAGCTGTCQALAPWEVEPNNSLATATPPWPGFSTWKASIAPLGDHDYFAFTLAVSGHVTLTTHDIDTPTVCSSDTALHLVDSMGTELAFDDDSGPGPGDPSGGKCSKISMFTLPAGTFFAWVQRYNDSKVIPGYQLDLVVQ